MKRIKALFNAIRVLGRNPHADLAAAWERVLRDASSADHLSGGGASNSADRHLIEQVIFGVQDEAESWLKKLGEQAQKDAAK